MKWFLLVLMVSTGVHAQTVEQFKHTSKHPLQLQIMWQKPVDLDIFVTDPQGETVYFANRQTKSGVQLESESGCAQVKSDKVKPPYIEQVSIPYNALGKYRVSVDFIKNCDSAIAFEDYTVRLLDHKGKVLGEQQSQVQFRLLNTVGWEFLIQ